MKCPITLLIHHPLCSLNAIFHPLSGCSSLCNEAEAVKRRGTTNNEPSDQILDQLKIIDGKMIDYLGKVRKDEAGKTEKDETELFCNSLIP